MRYRSRLDKGWIPIHTQGDCTVLRLKITRWAENERLLCVSWPLGGDVYGTAMELEAQRLNGSFGLWGHRSLVY